MLKSQLLEIIANGENSGVEFKRDNIRPEQLAKEIVALANFQGGMILLGVDDDGSISGVHRPNLEEWVMDSVIARRIHPLIIPFYEEIQVDESRRVAVLSFTQGTAKPYVLRNNDREEIYIRVGSVSRLATREQQARLFATGGLIHLESLPVSGTGIDSLDTQRVEDYFVNVLGDPKPPADREALKKRLCDMDFMTEAGLQDPVCAIAGLVLFGYRPRRYLKQAGLRVMAFDGKEKTYQSKLDEILDGPAVGLWKAETGKSRELATDGLLETFSRMTRPFLSEETENIDEGFRRKREWIYPPEVIRETVLNALAHRDWTRSVDIEIAVYEDRMEVISPGGLPNGMTVEKMAAGQRSPRNPMIMDVLRNYGYVDARGMGIRSKVIPLMRRLNKADPIFNATDDYLQTILPARKV